MHQSSMIAIDKLFIYKHISKPPNPVKCIDFTRLAILLESFWKTWLDIN